MIGPAAVRANEGVWEIVTLDRYGKKAKLVMRGPRDADECRKHATLILDTMRIRAIRSGEPDPLLTVVSILVMMTDDSGFTEFRPRQATAAINLDQYVRRAPPVDVPLDLF
jgi:hypothetical protein